MREGFFPTGEAAFTIESAAPRDESAILAMTERHSGPGTAAVVAGWWRSAPQAFRVARDGDGAVAAFLLLGEPRDAATRVIDRDPVAASWREDLRRRALPADQRVLFARHLLSREGEAPSLAQSALWVDAKRRYMELRPHLRRVYVTTVSPEVYAPSLTPLGFTFLPGPPATVDGREHRSLVLDFGPRSVDGWLAGLVASELDAEPWPRVDADRRELALDGRTVALTELELGIVGHLRDRAGRAVSRAELLSDVWGYAWDGGGNVVEVAISALRRKLGDHAGLIETVRGVGYRWREPGP